MIDSHCHLADTKFEADLSDVLLRAEEHGVEVMMCIADSLEEGKECIEMAEKYEQIFCTIGMHPHNAKEWNDDSVRELRDLLSSSLKVKALGEIGLDYHYDNSPRETQRSVLRTQLEIAKDMNLPVVVHNRESIDDLMCIVREVRPPSAVLHCCTERWEDVEEWVDMGYHLSFTGIATYPKSEEIRRTIERCPLDRMMVETDAPYLAPIPHRGKRNEPAYVLEVAKLIADVKGSDLMSIDRSTSENAVAFFGLAS